MLDACRIVLRSRRRSTCDAVRCGFGEGFDLPSTDDQAPLCEVFEISWFCAKWGKLSCVIFPEELSLVECPLRGAPALDVGIFGVRHDD